MQNDSSTTVATPTDATDLIARELDLRKGQIRATADLLADGATVPFICRYRKEVTGSLDEVAVTAIRNRLAQLAELNKRRQAILKSLAERELLSDILNHDIASAKTLTALEDIYLPYRPKRRTRATMARERGLEPLADLLLAHNTSLPIDPEKEAAAFVNPEQEVETIADALAGARDIIAEMVSEDQDARAEIREVFKRRALLNSRVIRGKAEAGAKFKDYFDWTEPAARAPSHRVLAMRRGEKEGFLNLRLGPDEDEAIRLLHRRFVQSERRDAPAAVQMAMAVTDGYQRLLSISLETELRLEMKKRADAEAIRVFAENLRELLLAPPLGRRRVLALDPGFRTGCKLVCLDRQGKLLHYDTIYPHTGGSRVAGAARKVTDLVKRFDIEAIAVGNGTAGRESEAFLRGLSLSSAVSSPPSIVMVNESGASIYSASDIARAEFPDHDITVRGSVSIGRRLMDPLAELVKIDAKSIGVGQYQHDVDQKALKQSLDDVVSSCVNAVGVDVNTASAQLLTSISGLGPQLAAKIVAHRDEHGPFASRAALKKVPRLGPKAFEQAAGFLRVNDGRNRLDASAVHPESYHVVKTMAADLDCTVGDLLGDVPEAKTQRRRIDVHRYVSDTIGLPTLHDILTELARPGRDPRAEFEVFRFADGINAIEDLEEGMQLPGIITNVTNFGAFIDIGVHQDGLCHISQLADRFVRDPAEVVKVQQRVSVRILGVDLARKRISLSMKSEA